ncbi:hypothetical protein [Mycolicibacterium porcinum]|nr:hypothetical protein [Mycolicibacterium porcinum]
MTAFSAIGGRGAGPEGTTSRLRRAALLPALAGLSSWCHADVTAAL